MIKRLLALQCICLIISIAVSNAYAYDYEADAKNWDRWTACLSDEECVPIHDACAGWTAVNKRFKKEGEVYQAELTDVVKCLDVKLKPEPKVLCLEQTCFAKPEGLDNEDKKPNDDTQFSKTH